MSVNSQLILGSKNSAGEKIATWILTYPRFFHGEFMTHRVFSRNAASSRAIPIEKALDAICENPAGPEFWGMNRAGMQATVEASLEERQLAKMWWKESANKAVISAEKGNALGLHKQIVNRVAEPFSHITVIATATDVHNFFSLRAHKDAQPEFQILAYQMLKQYVEFDFVTRDIHLPLTDESDHQDRIASSIARCARVSYVNHKKETTVEEDKILVDRLATSGHWSPFEHVAFARPGERFANFYGWRQARISYMDQCAKPFKSLESILEEIPEWIKEYI
jgi:thymidylate synthase ThyX